MNVKEDDAVKRANFIQVKYLNEKKRKRSGVVGKGGLQKPTKYVPACTGYSSERKQTCFLPPKRRKGRVKETFSKKKVVVVMFLACY